LEEFADGDGETRKKLGGFDGIVASKESIRAGGFENLHFLAIGIDDPNRVGAGGEVLFHFAHQLAKSVGGGDNLDGEIGRAWKITSFLPNPCLANECNIWSANCIVLQPEATVPCTHPS
jgi:hypothetical protein